jgi:hypothetical protein
VDLRKIYLTESFELDEMYVHGSIGTGSDIISYRGDIWIIDEMIDAKGFNDIITKLGLSDDLLVSDGDKVSNYDLYDAIRDSDRSDILTGVVNGKVLHLNTVGPFQHDPKSSIQVQKVVKALKLNSAVYSDDIDGNSSVKVSKGKMLGKIPDIVYHGTSSRYLDGILKSGLVPSPDKTNYDDIVHDDKIFFSSRFGEASHHAVTTSRKTKSKAIVLEIRIPDKNLVIPDYDIDMASGHTTYRDHEKSKWVQSMSTDRSMGMSREFGIYGYHGSILPQHIRAVYVLIGGSDTPEPSEYKKMTIKQIKKLLDIYGDLDVLGEGLVK